MPVCQLLSGLCCAMWYEQHTPLQSAHLSAQVRITFTAAGSLKQKTKTNTRIECLQLSASKKNKLTSTSICCKPFFLNVCDVKTFSI